MDDKKIGGIRPVGRQPLNQKVYESLKMSILCGNIAPGVKLSENQVALQMDTSTTPVREAFRMLAAEGLVK
ncbi:MAG: GntR family transcriptional regulator, partial [Oscillospiraceae bacterium]